MKPKISLCHINSTTVHGLLSVVLLFCVCYLLNMRRIVHLTIYVKTLEVINDLPQNLSPHVHTNFLTFKFSNVIQPYKCKVSGCAWKGVVLVKTDPDS